MPAYKLIIKGRVQGVFFRATSKEIADKTGVKGWVKNTPEGDVEAVVTGTEEDVQQFIQWCKKGPPGSKVTDVITSQHDETLFVDFSIMR